MKFRDPMHMDLVDRTIVENDYIVAQGSIGVDFSHHFDTYVMQTYTPVLGIWKVHKPMIIQKPEPTTRFINVWPYSSSHGYEGGREMDELMPVRIAKSKEDYDLALFALLPVAKPPVKEFPAESRWKILREIKDAFVTEKTKKPVTLAYVDHRYDLSAKDIEVAVPIMPMQIREYFFRNFLRCGHEMYTRYPDTSNSVLGEIRIPLEEARDIMENTVTPLLEERFDVALTKKERVMA